MLSNRPYLLRAFYQWIVDSGCNPILVIDANHPNIRIPKDYIEGGEIVFNISPAAVRDLKILNDCVEFKASFSGVVYIIYAPVNAILAVYAEENGEGIFFDSEENEGESVTSITQLTGIDGYKGIDALSPMDVPAAATKSKPILKLVE